MTSRESGLLGGRAYAPAQWHTVRSPFDNQTVGEVGVCSLETMDKAIDIADRAFTSMRALPTHKRIDILTKIAALIDQNGAKIAQLMTSESGKPIKLSRTEIARSSLTFRLGAAEAGRFGGEVIPVDIEARAEGRLCISARTPRGPVAAISPFNFPLNLIAHKLSPSFAIGTSVVLKPPPQCPLTGHFIGHLCLEAGLPPEALSVLHCEPVVAQKMVEDPRMKVLSFTGSDTVGWKLKALSGKKQVLLELGGNAPCVIDEGTKLDSIMDSIVAGAWSHGGQVCIKIQRLLIHASLHNEFLEKFIKATQSLKCGNPLDEQTMVGPLIDSHQVTRVLSWIDEARKKGAKIHCGGEAQGNVVLPTIMTHVPADARVCKDEVFGPVTIVEPFKNFDEALALCNQSRFGLQAGIFTPDLGKALKAFRTLDYGGVLINDIPTMRIDNIPYGGTKDSGFGREGVRYAMEEMSEPKVLFMRSL